MLYPFCKITRSRHNTPAFVVGAPLCGCPGAERPRGATPYPQQDVPVQDPAVHWSLQVAALPSSQVVPLGWNPFAGQLALVPVQASATSQAPAAARHTVVLALKVLAGQ